LLKGTDKFKKIWKEKKFEINSQIVFS
jgi:hypothetical protein